MGIVVLCFSGALFNKRIKDEEARNRSMIWSAVLLYFIFSLILNWYLRDILGWAHGVPGSDLQKYYDGARLLSQGGRFSDLVNISNTFEVSFSHIGYISYVLFIAITAMTPVIITTEISLQILYCVQGFVAVVSCLNIADFFANKDETRIRNKVFWMLLLCASVLQMSAILMRDIWIVFFISCLMHECKNDNNTIKCISLIVVCFLFRTYSVAITIPVLVGYKYNRKKLAAVVSLVVFSAFFIGQDLINVLARMIGVGWMYSFHFDLPSLLTYIMFPNPITQAHSVQHLNTGFHALFGGNTEWIYYMLSCWNVYVFPVCIYGIYRSIKDGESDNAALWGMIVINISMLMCLFYRNVSSPRYKLLIIFGIAYFYKKGTTAMSPIVRLIYFFCILSGLIVVLAVTG